MMARERIDLGDILDKFGRDTVDKIVDKINSVGAVRTGALRDSIDFRVNERGKVLPMRHLNNCTGIIRTGVQNSAGRNWCGRSHSRRRVLLFTIALIDK